MAGAKRDQQNPFDPHAGGFGAGIAMTRIDGQTFTAGRTGSLTQVAVFLERDLGATIPDGTIVLELYPTTGGKPRTDGPALGSGHLPIAAVTQERGFTTVRLTRPVPVTTGTVYAIILHTDVVIEEAAIAWDGSTAPDHYPRGGEAERPDDTAPWTVFPAQDFAFQTFVATHRHRHHHR
jgi:hypothetical protein